MRGRAVRVCIVTLYDLSDDGGVNRHAVRYARVPVVATFHANDDREPPLVRAVRTAASGALARVAFAIAVSRAA